MIISSLAEVGTVNVNFNYAIRATNTPTSFSASGLPGGLTLNASTGIILGKPTTAGVFKATINAINAAGTGTATLDITVNAAAGAAPVITSAVKASGLTGSAFSYQITATNTPLTFGAAGLPTGLVISAAGKITGNLSATPGQTTITLSAGNNSGTGQALLLLTVVQSPPAITSASTVAGFVGTAFSFTLTGSNAPQKFNASSLPPGLVLDSSTGIISGTPTAPGTSNITVTAQNAAGVVAAQLQISIFPPGTGGGPAAAVAITSGATAAGTMGAQFVYVITASGGGNMNFTASNLPAGLSLTGNIINGSPTVGQVITTFTVGASNEVGAASQTVTLTVGPLVAPAFTSSSSASFVEGVPGTFTVVDTGFTVPALTEAGKLPAGVTFDPLTGKLSGTPAAGSVGVYAITFTAANGTLPNAVQKFTLTVNVAPVITSAKTATFTPGVAGSFQITGTGTPKPSFTVTGNLPTGVTFDPVAFTLSGTPSLTAVGTYPLTITAQNGTVDAVQTFTLTVSDTLPALTSGPTASPASPGVGQLVTFTVGATGTNLKVNWDFGDSVTGTGASVTHKYSPAGTYTATATATNSAGSASGTVTVVVRAPIVGTGNDSDGDGFSDDFENLVGSDPNDPNSTPGGSTTTGTPVPVTLKSANIKLNFKKTSSDMISVKGTVPFPKSGTLDKQKFILDIGEVVANFTVDSKGQGASTKNGQQTVKLGKPKSGAVTFDVELKKGDYSKILLPYLANATIKKSTVSIPISIVFETAVDQKMTSFSYTAKKGTSGTATSAH